MPTDRELQRGEVARALGVSVSSVVRMEQRAELHPRVASDGVRWFSPSEIESARQHRLAQFPSVLSEGEVAGRAFELFRDEKSVVDVVIALRQTPTLIRALYRDFAITGDMVLPAAVVKRLRGFHFVPKPLTPTGLVDALETLMGELADARAEIEDFRESAENRAKES